MGYRQGVAAAALLLLTSACAQQGGMSGTAGPNAMIPNDHWTLSTFDQDGQYSIASVMASTNDDLLNVTCDPTDIYVSINPKRSLPAVVANRGLALAFDGGAPIAQHWKTGTLTGSGFGSQDYFEVDAGDPQFDAVIAAFKQHREVDVSITDSGTEVQHQTFTLNGAPEQIAKVEAACKKS